MTDERRIMKKIIECEDQEGLLAFLGEPITVYCMNYIYTGTLIGVNDTYIKLDKKDACIVYETGPLTDAKFKDAQKCGRDRYVMIQAIETFEAGK